jgi:hypothetical protein
LYTSVGPDPHQATPSTFADLLDAFIADLT